MTIEEYIIAALSETLEIPVSGDKPTPMPKSFCTVEKTASREADHVPVATITVNSWGETREEAMQLNERVKTAMTELAERPEISQVDCETDYNYPDLTTKKPRYQARFSVVYFL